MPSINKQSLREEFDQLKDEFEHLSNTGKITTESRTLFRAMIILFELLIAVFMEKQTKKNNRNSSIPSSQTDKDETATGVGSNGKGKKLNDVYMDSSSFASNLLMTLGSTAYVYPAS